METCRHCGADIVHDPGPFAAWVDTDGDDYCPQAGQGPTGQREHQPKGTL